MNLDFLHKLVFCLALGFWITAAPAGENIIRVQAAIKSKSLDSDGIYVCNRFTALDHNPLFGECNNGAWLGTDGTGTYANGICKNGYVKATWEEENDISGQCLSYVP